MQQVRMSTAQVLLASCIRATLCFWERPMSGRHSRSMPTTLSAMLACRLSSAPIGTGVPQKITSCMHTSLT